MPAETRNRAEWDRRYREKNRNDINARGRARYQDNIEKEQERSREYGKGNPEKARKRAKKYYELHPERCIEASRLHREKNPEEVEAATRRWREGHPENMRMMRNRYKLKKYGLTAEDFFAILEGQGGLCAICGDVLDKPYIDHDHDTGEVRGLLCLKCNAGIGMLNDDPEILKSAREYLLSSLEKSNAS